MVSQLEKQLIQRLSKSSMDKFNRFIIEKLSLTLEYHDEMNPLLWDESEMKPVIRERLLQIGQMWQKFAHIPDDAVRDIVMTGGNANYNYTPHSDIDIHIMVNLSKMDIDKDFLSDYLFDKKALWAFKHPTLSVFGYPVELYAQDYKEPVVSTQGLYSLQKAKWINKPKHENISGFDGDLALRRKVLEYKRKIEKILTEPGDHTHDLNQLKIKFFNMRSAGIHRAGDYSMENLIYKALRNMGYVDQMNLYIQQKQDEMLSLR